MPERFIDDSEDLLGDRLRTAMGRITGRLAEIMAHIGDPTPEMTASLHFLESLSAPAAESLDARGDHPIDLIVSALDLSAAEFDLILLAAMPEEHEGLASVVRELSPRREPWPTVGLAAQMFCTSRRERGLLRRVLECGPAVAAGVLHLDNDLPFFERTLRLADRLWPALLGIDAWPSSLVRPNGPVAMSGMVAWLEDHPARRAVAALQRGVPVTILVTAASPASALERAAALARHAAVPAVRLASSSPIDAAQLSLVNVHSLVRGVVPLLQIPVAERGPTDLPPATRFPGPLVVAAETGTIRVEGARPLITVPAVPLSAMSRRRMWSELLPEMANRAPELASRHPIEPAEAARAATDARTVEALDGEPMTLGDVSASVRIRAGLTLSSGVKLVHPVAGWEQLVLPPDKLAQLRLALARLRHQALVLDEWGFLAGRSGARGVRMMFTGPPGTGKTLSAEVMANDLGVDLLTVDISRVVSKWIGETEKNLSEVFDAAERSQAVLFFDEADALFSRRTEVSDAHDRYANLETAYLLARLERFEGLAILASNLKSNIDPAFLRRLEFVVDFRPPNTVERADLWRCHLPAGAPLAPDVETAALAARFPVVGGLIRNATAAAAFVAADSDTPISHELLVEAMQSEYEKAGLAYPASPATSAS